MCQRGEDPPHCIQGDAQSDHDLTNLHNPRPQGDTLRGNPGKAGQRLESPYESLCKTSRVQLRAAASTHVSTTTLRPPRAAIPPMGQLRAPTNRWASFCRRALARLPQRSADILAPDFRAARRALPPPIANPSQDPHVSDDPGRDS